MALILYKIFSLSNSIDTVSENIKYFRGTDGMSRNTPDNNANVFKENGVWRGSSWTNVPPVSNAIGILLCFNFDANYGYQLYEDYMGDLYKRNRTSSSTWGEWKKLLTETVASYTPTLNTTNVQSAELRLNVSGKVAKLIITNLVLKNAVTSDTVIATLPNSIMSGGQGVARGFGISLSGKLHEFHINPSTNVVYIAGLNSPTKENIYGELTFMLQ